MAERLLCGAGASDPIGGGGGAFVANAAAADDTDTDARVGGVAIGDAAEVRLAAGDLAGRARATRRPRGSDCVDWRPAASRRP